MANDLVVIAHNSAEMAESQKQLLAWAERKVAEARADEAEIRQNLTSAKEHKWRTSGLETGLRVAKRQREFYQKIGAAVRLGYVIVPNFPVDVFAIRTDRVNPEKGETSSENESHAQSPKALPEGQGRYVSSDPVVYQHDHQEKDQKTGALVPRPYYFAEAFRDVAFPISAVKPMVMDDAGRAMAHLLFDDLGISPKRARRNVDPMIIGRIHFMPTRTRWDRQSPTRARRTVSFLVSWWLTNRDLEVGRR